MDTGIYVALSKEIGILRDLDVTANNLANMTTDGFEGDQLLFSQYLTDTTPQENKVAFANNPATWRDMTQGSMQVTGNPLDAAIEGTGYFVVQTSLGPRYTRNGNFKVGPDGTLVTSDGYPLMDETNQPITFDPLDRVIQLNSDGTVNVDGTGRATLKIVQFDNPQLMHRQGNTLYSADAPPKPADNFQVVGGMLERSNVQSFTQVTHLIELSRTLAFATNYINSMYTLEQKASDTLAKIYT